MDAIFIKLNFKNQTDLLVLNAPVSFESKLSSLDGVMVHNNSDHIGELCFSLAFAMTQNEINEIAKELIVKIKGDAILWFAYPKRTSKKYKSDISRDNGWSVLGEAGFEAVRQIAIDEDWSALRFRRVEFIKSIAREPKRALSLKGRASALSK